jgi:site-specific DNA-methyltransferase (adenine-specific)
MQGELAGAVVTDPPYGMNLDTKMSSRAGHKDEWEYTPKHYDKVIGDDTDYDPAPIFENWGSCAEIFLWGADYYAESIPARKQGSWLVWDKREGIEDIKFSLSSFELCWSKARHSREIIRQRWMGLMGTESQDVRSRVHPTQKPIEVFDWIISKYSSNGAIIVDPYLGSGTTLIACERLGRKCRAVEISPAYVAVAIQRWVDVTGGEPVLVE